MKAMDNGDSQPTVTAVLGPTNTGKTYLAVERMLGHASGMIGFPLRLLARENYDLVCRLRGKGCAALITGEERIVPAQPRYFLCTVEAMPLDRRVEFLAIDEIQLCADAERGHIFTDRLLHARGERETMLLGAETMAPAIRRLVPEAKFVRRPRFSQLSYTGRRKLARLPPRSAVVAFSASDVYALAELIRRQRGGAAVVMGALSPRTRNAQVGMYEAGEVDYLVATDAIGMGLNMDIDHVAFAAQVKFDGRVPRRLTPAEMAQIAGRAGRHMNDGTFGVTAREREIDAETVEAVEAHQFKPVGAVRWRNPALDFRSLDGLKRSLEMRPPGPSLVRSRDADDYVALAHLMNSAEIHDMATTPEAIRLLWDVCRIPNFDNAVEDTHASMLGRIYRFLRSNAGVVPAEYAARALDRLNRTDGDIDTLVARIARTRTWTYLSHRHQWFADAAHWQQWARTLEDKLSDALHDRLTQRFVDSHAGAVVRRMRARGHRLLGAIAADGTVFVEGHAVGRLEGMRFVLDDNEDGGDSDLLTSARRVIRDHIDARVAALERSSDPAFSLDENSRICWRDAPVARLAVGTEWLRPVVDVAPADLLEPHQRERVRRRLAAWLGTVVRQRLSALFAVADSSELGGAARGLAFQIVQGGGTVARRGATAQLRDLTADGRATLARLGIRFGVESVYMPVMLKPPAVALRAQLWHAYSDREAPPDLPDGRRPCMPASGIDADLCTLLGYRLVGGFALRVDMLERLLAELRRGTRAGPFIVPRSLLAMIGVGVPDFALLLDGLGYGHQEDEAGIQALRQRQRRRRHQHAGNDAAARDGATPKTRDDGESSRIDSPFARLAELRHPTS